MCTLEDVAHCAMHRVPYRIYCTKYTAPRKLHREGGNCPVRADSLHVKCKMHLHTGQRLVADIVKKMSTARTG